MLRRVITLRLGSSGREPAALDLDPPAHRELARRLAEESIVLLANDRGALPLAAGGNYAMVGPLAADDLQRRCRRAHRRHPRDHHQAR